MRKFCPLQEPIRLQDLQIPPAHRVRKKLFLDLYGGFQHKAKQRYSPAPVDGHPFIVVLFLFRLEISVRRGNKLSKVLPP